MCPHLLYCCAVIDYHDGVAKGHKYLMLVYQIEQQCTRLLWVQVMRSRILPMKKIAMTMRSHRELLLNYFRAKRRLSSG